MNYSALPKIDLHCHLDGSVRPSTLIELAHQQNIILPSNDVQTIQQMMTAPPTCKDLDEYLQCFSLPLSVMQTETAIERISFELFEDAALENVKYLEVRFGPLLHQTQGLSLDQVIGSAVRGMQRAEQQYDIRGNYILSVIRNMPEDNIKAVLDAGETYLNHGVVAFDLAGSEIAGFCHQFIPYAEYALIKGYHVTIHAGEQGVGQNVYDAVTLLGASRIGHGIHIKNHPQAYQLVKKQNIALETCPTSNVQTKAVDQLQHHPVQAFLKDGIEITINTDNRTVSDTTMTDEIRKVTEAFQLTEADYYTIYRMSLENAFTSDTVKEHLRSFIPLKYS
ncbi:Adenine deaminase [Vibrio aerogenes CECT 7868]|uniref:Adenosine deaminase n=1 Tax=Vibrio aerogenes CECT 7868 TaxID=1216006 RepID=A0A1M6A1U6_9VIBR|nr:adenosine deaminase [Vibrio aerogenes]SHI30450.1 Adenine deaminase [Vibrio aerogenes CECT 7868]